MKNEIIENKPNNNRRLFWIIFLPVIFLFIIGLLSASISFSRQGHYILGGDLYYPLDPQLEMARIPFAWDARYATGQTSEGRHIPSLIFFLFFFILDKLSIPLIVSQKIAIFGIFSLTAPAMYYLVLIIYRYQQREINARICLIAFISAFFYNFNLWNLFNWSAPSVHLQLAYLATPLILAFFIQGIKNYNYLYVCLIALLSVLFTPAASNPIYILNIFWPVVFLLFFILIKQMVMRDWEGVSKSLLFSLVVATIFILINSWWILLMIDTLKNSVSDIVNNGNFWSWMDQKSVRSSFLNIFRLINHEAWNNTTPGNLIIASANVYANNAFFIIMSFIFPLLAFLKLLQKKKNFFVLYFSTMAFIMIFLAKGLHWPLSVINDFLHKKILFLTLYRSVEWYTPMIVLSYAYLFGEGVFFIYDFFCKIAKEKIGVIILIFLILVGFIYNYPFWIGKVVHQGVATGEMANSYFVKIPSWYFAASKWINSQHYDFRIVSAPSAVSYYHTDWGFSGGELGVFLFNKPVINNVFGSGRTQDLSSLALNFLIDRDNKKSLYFTKILNLMNVKYVVVRNDVAYFNLTEKEMLDMDSSQITERLKSQTSMLLKKTIGRLTFFNNKELLPHFYIPLKFFINENVMTRSLIDIVSQPDYQIRSVIYFTNQNKDKIDEIKSLGSNISDTSILEFKKINPIKYRVKIHNASNKFPLVFSENFNNRWKAYLVKNRIQNSVIFDFIDGREFKIKIDNYAILDNNEDDQASKEELQNYIDNNWVSDLGEKKQQIDFVSKNFQGTIQNDNLSKGRVWETWFKKPLPEENHLMANGYVNSWIINSDEICKNNNSCVRNPDGSYDFELIVEFWPQRLFYAGVAVSGATLVLCLIYLGYDFIRGRRKILIENNDAKI